jgi:hypothetical protein
VIVIDDSSEEEIDDINIHSDRKMAATSSTLSLECPPIVSGTLEATLPAKRRRVFSSDSCNSRTINRCKHSKSMKEKTAMRILPIKTHEHKGKEGFVGNDSGNKGIGIGGNCDPLTLSLSAESPQKGCVASPKELDCSESIIGAFIAKENVFDP